MTELPPRARRIQYKARINKEFGGTTSACAENTGVRGHSFYAPWNYLRVRGEYFGVSVRVLH